MFVDKATITVKAGDGGNGCCSFHREKYVPRGGPDGGDGGGGGNVILEATNSEQSLQALVFNRHYQAQSGPGGKGSNMVAEFLRDFGQAREKRGLNFTTAGSINNGSRLSGMRLLMAAVQRYGRY